MMMAGSLKADGQGNSGGTVHGGASDSSWAAMKINKWVLAAVLAAASLFMYVSSVVKFSG